jgi:hypothetical protein
MIRGRLAASLVLVLGAVALSGCGDNSGPVLVSGDVIYDGTPVKKGVVRFVPVNGDAPTASAHIEEGKFTVKLAQTEFRVEFSAAKLPEVGLRGEEIAMDELFPDKYTHNSEVKLKVSRGMDPVKFDLPK